MIHRDQLQHESKLFIKNQILIIIECHRQHPLCLARISQHPSTAAADRLSLVGRTPSIRLDVVSATPALSLGPAARQAGISTPSQRTVVRNAGQVRILPKDNGIVHAEMLANGLANWSNR